MAIKVSGELPVVGKRDVGVGVTVAAPAPSKGVIVTRGTGMPVAAGGDVDVGVTDGAADVLVGAGGGDVRVGVGVKAGVNVGVAVAGTCAKFAVTVVSVIILIVTGLAFPLRPPPDQLLNCQPGSAVALKIAFVPERYCVPLGGVTEPLPFLLIVRV